ncbi:MAG: hypothetical protein AB8G17_11275 [Gammaproteobacteria bacterium]
MPRTLVSNPCSERAASQRPGVYATLACTATLLMLAATASAGPREQAKVMHDRLTGAPPTADELDATSAQIADGDAAGAALAVTLDDGFYNVTLKNFIAPATNRDQSVFVPLNDYSATFIGMVRDDVPMNTLLSADLVYVSEAAGLPAYSATNNDHYEQLESRGISLRDTLAARTQSQLTSLPATATAGIMTTRGAAEAFFIDGTNRAMFRFTLLNHMCRDLEQVADTSRPPDRIRQDVSRSPGGDSRLFLNNCIGCHSGMDPLAQAFAYYDFDENVNQLVYTEGQVQEKYGINEDTFKFGFVTPDDSWDNYWRTGRNGVIGWDENRPASGNGAKSLGEELANTEVFASCQVTKVFRNVCLRDPVDAADRAQIETMTQAFKSDGYSLRPVFADAAVYCMGE